MTPRELRDRAAEMVTELLALSRGFNMGDSSGALARRVDTMGGTFKSNLQVLQTSFNRFADANMGKVLDPPCKDIKLVCGKAGKV
jgi:hypothetical protein